jgi:hypothetical protein
MTLKEQIINIMVGVDLFGTNIETAASEILSLFPQGNCNWEYDEETYATDCGHNVYFDDSEMSPNHKYCPYCGKMISLSIVPSPPELI